MLVDQPMAEAVRNKSAVLVIGTGVTAASVVDDDVCSWPGLLERGVEYLNENGLMRSPEYESNIRNDISIGKEDSSYLLSAAQKLIDHMGGHGSPHVDRFFSHSIGALQVDPAKKRLVQGLDKLDLPIVTVNYDTILEDITGRPSATWMQPNFFRAAIKRDSNHVVHLHGIHTDTESIVLNTNDYARIEDDANTRALRQAFAVANTMIFVGFGAGVDDPHFSSIWQWLSPLKDARARHYFLCLESDLAPFNERFQGRPLLPVPYGTDYKDLPVFVEKLVSVSKVPDQASKTMGDPSVVDEVRRNSRLRIVDSVVDSAILPTPVAGDQEIEPDIDELVLPPVLLPVPSEQFAHEQSKSDSKLERLKPLDELASRDVMTVTGEEQSGLSTALAWLVSKKSDMDRSIPIVVDYGALGEGPNPIQTAVRKHLRSSGAPLGNKAELPKNVALAIDNVTAPNDKALNRLVSDVVSYGPSIVIYGCRPGAEARLQEAHENLKTECTPAYLGKLGHRATVELAKRVNARQADTVAKRVLSITEKEGLARTPLSITLLIIGVAQDQSWITTVSNTTFVDAFVDSLLGRGGFADDMHLQIDSGGYSMVCEAISRRLIADDSESILRLDLLTFITGIVDSLDWSDRPERIVSSLERKGILVDRDGSVRFRQSAYLHIFAARAAKADAELLESLKQRPLYYSSVLRNYAALQRNDKRLLQWANSLLEHVDDYAVGDRGMFEPIGSYRAESHERRFDSPSGEESSDGDDVVEDSGEQEHDLELAADDGGVDREELEDDEPYDHDSDADLSPFPTTDFEAAPPELQLVAQLDLVSNILRDSELVEDADLKMRVLNRVLRGWGIHMNYVHASPTLNLLVDRIGEIIRERSDMTDDDLKDLKENLVEQWSFYEMVVGIQEELATAKLERAADRTIENLSEADDLVLAVPALVLKALLQGNLWAPGGRATQLLLRHHDIKLIRIFVRVVAEWQYRVSPNESRVADIENFLVDYYTRPHAAMPRSKLGLRKSLVLQRLRMLRAKSRARQSLMRQSRRELPNGSTG